MLVIPHHRIDPLALRSCISSLKFCVERASARAIASALFVSLKKLQLAIVFSVVCTVTVWLQTKCSILDTFRSVTVFFTLNNKLKLNLSLPTYQFLMTNMATWAYPK